MQLPAAFFRTEIFAQAVKSEFSKILIYISKLKWISNYREIRVANYAPMFTKSLLADWQELTC